MEPIEDQRPFAWQPLTPRGVAAFAPATFGRLLLIQLLVAVLTALVVVWSVANDWFPTIRTAIENLPAQGSIQAGQLNWNGDSPSLLAESRFLALVVDVQHSGKERSPAHLQVEFGKTDLWVYSVFGCLQVPYPREYIISFGLQALKPWWGAWTPALLGGLGLAVTCGLMLVWTVLATLYCLPAWLLGLYSNRQLTFFGSWRLAGAALIPGALVMTGVTTLYSLGGLDVPHLLTAWVLHLVLGWGYVLFGVLALPKHGAALASKTNPFGQPTGAQSEAASKPSSGAQSSNPFLPKR